MRQCVFIFFAVVGTFNSPAAFLDIEDIFNVENNRFWITFIGSLSGQNYVYNVEVSKDNFGTIDHVQQFLSSDFRVTAEIGYTYSNGNKVYVLNSGTLYQVRVKYVSTGQPRTLRTKFNSLTAISPTNVTYNYFIARWTGYNWGPSSASNGDHPIDFEIEYKDITTGNSLIKRLFGTVGCTSQYPCTLYKTAMPSHAFFVAGHYYKYRVRVEQNDKWYYYRGPYSNWSSSFRLWNSSGGGGDPPTEEFQDKEESPLPHVLSSSLHSEFLIELFPNPADNILTLTTIGNTELSNLDFRLHSISGQEYYTRISWIDSKTANISLEKLKSGVYILTVIGLGQHNIKRKFLKN